MLAVVIRSRFCGPPTTGNGGYSAGMLARELGNSVEVTLRKPPPLERELEVRAHGNALELRDGEELVAEARVAEVELDVPTPPPFERASELSERFVWFQRHEFPTCFVCGPARAVGDGLRIFPGAERTDEPVASPWIPSDDLAGDDGIVRPEIVWASLDCPGYFGGAGPDYPKALLGRIAASVRGSIRAGERCVAMGWSLGKEGRKIHAATALFGADSGLRAVARQTWIVV
jgi:hypothetical protein